MPASESNPKSAIRNPQSAIARRDFLAWLGRGALWATAGVTVVALLRYLSFTEPTPPQVFVLDEPSAYPSGATTPVADGRGFIKHDERGLYAINATCTHLGCLVKQAQAGFECPCHSSQFAANGAVIQGPATLPLTYAALTLTAEGKVVVDVSQQVAETDRLTV
jgi:cytochrome b6-f complex iron-sulfur subunit